MERLTYKHRRDKKAYLFRGLNEKWRKMPRYDVLDKAIQKLYAYEIAEQNGTMCILPYPIGTPIHKVCYSAKTNDGFIYSTTMSLKFYADNINDFKEGLIHSDEKAAQQALLDKIHGESDHNDGK